MDGYSLSREFWDFAFENPEKVKPTHIAIYFFAVEHCNRLGWKVKFGLPTAMVLDAIGIKSYSVYKKCFDDLAEWQFFEVLEYSKNQYSANIIALKENCKAHSKATNKALDKAMVKHVSKQVKSTCQSNDSIDKHINLITNKQNNNETIANVLKSSESSSWLGVIAMQNKKDEQWVKTKIDEFLIFLLTQMKVHKSKSEFVSHFTNWLPKKIEGIKIESIKNKPFYNSPIL